MPPVNLVIDGVKIKTSWMASALTQTRVGRRRALSLRLTHYRIQCMQVFGELL